MEKVSLENGKYEIKVDDKTGAMTFLRNGEAWPAAQEAFQHAKLMYCMVARILELEQGNAGLVEALKQVQQRIRFGQDLDGADRIVSEALAAAGVKC